MSHFAVSPIQVVATGQGRGYDQRNRLSCDQWDNTTLVCSAPYRDGLLWSTSSGIGGTFGAAMGPSGDAGCSGNYESDTLQVGNSSHKRIVGTARDSTGAVFPSGAIVSARLTAASANSAADTIQGSTTADTAGYFEVPTREAGTHYLTATYASIPPKTGMTANTLTPTS